MKAFPLGVQRFFAETGVKESDWHSFRLTPRSAAVAFNLRKTESGMSTVVLVIVLTLWYVRNSTTDQPVVIRMATDPTHVTVPAAMTPSAR